MRATQWLAMLVALACFFLLCRLALGAHARGRLDAWLRRRWDGGLQAGRAWRASRRGSGPPSTQAAQDLARNLAQEAIARAQRGAREVDREGNVLRPRSFRSPERDKPPSGPDAT